MKKAEKRKIIEKSALEYAKSGECSGWQSIEFKLRSEGFHEARVELDRRHLREQLDDLCKLAQSGEERDRRSEFKVWIRLVLENRETVLFDNDNISFLSAHEEGLYISGKGYSVELKRKFMDRKLEYSLTVEAPNGRGFRLGFKDLEDDRGFDQIGIDDLRLILNSLASQATVRMKHL